ncbi:hypothetical protein V6N11_017965 [Hibiscus sabdariffa]|uniref:Uncharacterized protein n=1 Tax=Hibiscus sabdariffa TaxID=183260 RepID=A0ABR2T5Y8_9ROSI
MIVVDGFSGLLDDGESPAQFDLEQNSGNRQMVENIGWDSVVQNPDSVKISVSNLVKSNSGVGLDGLDCVGTLQQGELIGNLNLLILSYMGPVEMDRLCKVQRGRVV